MGKKTKMAAASSSAENAGENGSGYILASSKRGEADMHGMGGRNTGDTPLGGFAANDHVSSKPSSDAVRRLEVDTDEAHDNRAVLERNQAIHKGLKDGSLEKGVYRGMGAYKQYAERSDTAISMAKSTGNLGPVRGSMTNVRTTLRIKYIGTTGEGGICKDYKDTGYCGFGDSCKFLHDRSDYKPSYILEKEWEEQQKAIQDKKRRRWERRLKRKHLAGKEGMEADDSSD